MSKSSCDQRLRGVGIVFSIVVLTGCARTEPIPPAPLYESLSCQTAVGGDGISAGEFAQDLHPVPTGVVPPDFSPVSVTWCIWDRRHHTSQLRATSNIGLLAKLNSVYRPDDPIACPGAMRIDVHAILVSNQKNEWISFRIARICQEPTPDVEHILSNWNWD